ncbi:MAG: HNH endonuclease, partial [Deltaproteobacteria bacterium]|nr:HNH endonuclease [Nannocystaceae bacterium]
MLISVKSALLFVMASYSRCGAISASRGPNRRVGSRRWPRKSACYRCCMSVQNCVMEQGGMVRRADGAAPTWAGEVASTERRGENDWQSVDRALRTIARRRAGLDAEEARWLREAEALQIWEELGMVSMSDYLERVLMYAPRTAQERMRVARALGTLPRLAEALGGGELSFSAVRELTRVAIPSNEQAWIAAAQGKNLREVEELVADHRPGDGPEDPKDPAARRHVVRLELSAETFALLRQARQVLDDEHGTGLSEDQLVAALCGAVLDGDGAAADAGGRAKFQISLTVCERCNQGWQHGAGAQIAIGADAVDRACCDAQHIGSIDGEAPERAYQDVSPSVRRFVWHRDGGRCRVPGCRSSRGLEVHHIVHRADDGGHDASNVCLLCSSCHQAHHAGTLMIRGTATELEVRRPA